MINTEGREPGEIPEDDKCGCDKNPKSAPHTCPYASELYGDEKLCTCCEDCTHNCAMDI